jgi:hypothetical protein
MNIYTNFALAAACICLVISGFNAWYVIFKSEMPWRCRIGFAFLDVVEQLFFGVVYLGIAYLVNWLDGRFNLRLIYEGFIYVTLMLIALILAFKAGNRLTRWTIKVNSAYLGQQPI